MHLFIEADTMKCSCAGRFVFTGMSLLCLQMFHASVLEEEDPTHGVE